ncbi:ribonuclease Z [Gammaproteobacteria bacterium ESL0073]|nr:ribonuclease Z [Gammaproteobacteria bacterium ESL0073]
MELFFLGTGSGLPSNERNVSCCVLNLMKERKALWVFDCGEGAQHQFLKTPLKIPKIEKIFITHLHGDHLFGLPGLLSSRSFAHQATPLTVYGPRGIKEYLTVVMNISASRVSYQLEVKEIEEGVVFEDEQFIVSCLPLTHRIESYGFRVVEKDKPGALNTKLLAKLKVPEGPHLKQLKEGKEVELADGRILQGKDFITSPIKGKVVVIFGDTVPTKTAIVLASNADVMVHEATFEDALEELAEKYGHSTTTQVAKIAKKANAKKLIITHISSRYSEQNHKQLLDECRKLFKETEIANDFSHFII